MKYRKYITGSLGVVILGLAVFAEQIGLDNDPGWGRGRILMLEIGGVLVAINAIAIIFRNGFTNISALISKIFERFDAVDYSIRLNIFSFLAIIVVSAVYIWSFLPFANSNPTTNNYSQLAIAFKDHQLFLHEKPPPALLALSDPYDWGARYSIRRSFTMDVSLYKGRFYLYWGPVPSLLLMMFSNERLQVLGDQYVFLVFLYGLFLYSFLLIRSSWEKFNQALPAWMIGVALLAIGISGPIAQLLNLSSIYEAAVVGCQLFFIGGCYWAYSAIRITPMSSWKIAIASLHWALAIGTRITILPAILFLSFTVLFHVWKENKLYHPGKLILNLSAIVFPLLILMVGLGWYNYARFGSVSEFGIRYQLAQVDYHKFTKVFSPDYLSGNFQNYFLKPFKTQPKFPFLRAIETVSSNERITGLLYTTPFFLITLIPLGRTLYSRTFLQTISVAARNGLPAENWLVLGLASSSLILLSIILLYYYPAVRFTEEFLPAMMLLATISLGRGYEIFKERAAFRQSYLFFVVVLVIFSITVSILSTVPLPRTNDALLFIKQVWQFIGLR
ncbi:MAG: hypothetical protein IH588_17180 [Anaerolineales bacterium]|nr:hypothetical protein [Anaerolineales bacterium]